VASRDPRKVLKASRDPTSNRDKLVNLVADVLLVEEEPAVVANKMSLSPKKPSGKWLVLIV
jgi:hypothetical protein